MNKSIVLVTVDMIFYRSKRHVLIDEESLVSFSAVTEQS